MAAALGFGVAHPRLRRAAFRALDSAPCAFEVLLRIAAGEGLPRLSRVLPLGGSTNR
jgi:hypothetical protein